MGGLSRRRKANPIRGYIRGQIPLAFFLKIPTNGKGALRLRFAYARKVGDYSPSFILSISISIHASISIFYLLSIFPSLLLLAVLVLRQIGRSNQTRVSLRLEVRAIRILFQNLL